jgi:PAS domain S-box-containing protein
MTTGAANGNSDGPLAARERELAAIYSNVPGILFYVAIEPDGEFRFLSMSDAGLAAMGLPRDQVVGALVRNVIPPPSRDLVLNYYREAMRTRQTVRWNEVSVYPAGERIGEVAVTPLHDASGRATHLVGIVHDITELQHLTDALQRREERLAFLVRLNDVLRPLSEPSDIQRAAAGLLGEYLKANRVGYAEVDDHGYVIRHEYTNGVEPNVARGKAGSFGAALCDAYRRGEMVVVNDVQTDPRFTDEERARLDTQQMAAFIGLTLVKEGKVMAAFGANHATPRVWIASEVEIIRDVAERTWDAVGRARVEAALRQREERLRLVLDASGGGSWTWDTRTQQIYWDDQLRVCYGFAPNEPPTFETWLSRVHEDDRPQVLKLLNDVRHGTAESWDNTFRIVLPDGTEVWIQGLGHVERDNEGHVTRLTGLELDVTARRRADEAIQARRDEQHHRERAIELERLTSQLRRLASELTLAEQRTREQLAVTMHDGLQQVLFGVALNLARLERDAAGSPLVAKIVEARSDVEEAMNAARSLNQELLPPVLNSATLPAAVRWLAEWMQLKYGVKVDVTADPGADVDREDVLTLVFESLREVLFNVIRHADVDRAAVDVAIAPDNLLVITVADEGCGFDVATLFDRMNTHQAGLGIFSIRERLTLLGGRFEIDSAPGRGTICRLIAPRVSASGGAVGGSASRDNPLGGTRPTYDLRTRRAARLSANRIDS